MNKRKGFKIYKRTMAILLAAVLVLQTFQSVSITAYAAESAGSVSVADAISTEITDTEAANTELTADGQADEKEAGAEISNEAGSQEAGTSANEEAASENTGESEEAGTTGEDAGASAEETGEESSGSVEDTNVSDEETDQEDTDVSDGETDQEDTDVSDGETDQEDTNVSDEENSEEDTDVSDEEATEEDAQLTDEELAEEDSELTDEELVDEEGKSEDEISTDEETSLAYTGTVYADGEGLGVYFWEMSEAGMEFSDENLIAILNAHAGEEYTYLQISYEDIADAVSKDVWNAAVAVMKEESHLYIDFTGGALAADEMWIIKNPTKTSSDITASADWTINEDDGNMTISFGNTAFPCDVVNFSITAYQTNTEEIYNSLKNVFAENSKLTLKNSSGETVNEADHDVQVSDNKVEIGIDQVNSLTANETYAVDIADTTDDTTDLPYTGDILEDGTLAIQASLIEANYEKFDDEILLKILQARAAEGECYANVSIFYDKARVVIDADVWNAAVSLLDSDESVESLSIMFPNDTAPNETWYFEYPWTTETDLSTALDMTINESGKGITIKAENTNFPANNTSLTFAVDAAKADYEKFVNAFGKDQETLELVIKDEKGNRVYEDTLGKSYIYDSSYAKLNLDIASNLEDEKVQLESGASYTILPSSYRGVVGETNIGLVLYIDPADVGKDSFTLKEIENILAEWRETRFYEIYISYPASDSNVISKEVFNLLRGYLGYEEDIEQMIRVIFSDSNTGETVDWAFHNPYEATADIKLNAEISLSADEGTRIKFSSNAYPAERVVYCYGVLVSGLTEEESKWLEESFAATEGDILLNIASSAIMPWVSCYTMERDENGDINEYGVLLDNVNEYTPNTEYLLVPVNVISQEDPENSFYLWEDEANSKKLTTKKTPDAGTKVKWTSYNKNVMTISSAGAVETYNMGTVYYSASYKADGKQVFEVYRNQVGQAKIASIAFKQSAVTVTLFEDGEAVRDRLEVKFFPYAAAGYQGDLEWIVQEVDGDEVIELINLYEDYDDTDEVTHQEVLYDGTFIAKNPGTAIITATVPDTEISASCTINVMPAEEVPEEIPELYAVTCCDTTLKDVEFPAEEEAEAGSETKGSWRWVDETTNLTAYTGMDGATFPAIYTDSYGRETIYSIWVSMITIEEIDIVEVSENEAGELMINPLTETVSLMNGETIILAMDLVELNNYNGVEKVEEYLTNGRIKESWSVSPKNTGEVQWEDCYQFTADKNSSGKKTFTVTLTDTKTNKKIASATQSVTVLKGKLADLDYITQAGNMVWYCENDKSGQVGEKGTLVLKMPAESYYKLTVKSPDTTKLKLGSAKVDDTSEEGVVLTKIPYEIKGEGKLYLSITAADELKSNILFEAREIIDYSPAYTGEMLSINKKWTDQSAQFKLQLAEDTYIKAEELTAAGSYSSKFTFTADDAGEKLTGTPQLRITLADTSLKSGKHKLNVSVPVYAEETDECVGTYTINITVNVTDKVPSVTFKQTGKVNIFYNDEEGYGTLTVNVKGTKVTSLALADVTKDGKTTACAYELIQLDDTTYAIKHKEGGEWNTKDGRKGVLTYQLEGYPDTYTKSLTVAVQEKAPAMELSEKKNTLYPDYGVSDSSFYVMDKATQYPIDISKIQWKNPQTGKFEDLMGWSEMTEITLNNSYMAYCYGISVGFQLDTSKTMKAKTDKFTFQIWEENWRKPVTVNYSLTVSLKVPKLSLSSKTLTLNVNEDIYDQVEAYTRISYENCDRNPQYSDCWIVGVDAKSKAVLNHSLLLEDQFGGLFVRCHAQVDAEKKIDTRPKTGTYKFYVYVDVGAKEPLKTTLTVKVVDKKPEKCVKVTAKGSIDVLNRENTFITYTPKLSNLWGFIGNAWLTGRDADLFDCEWNGSELIVKAKEGVNYSTKANYQVTPVFRMGGVTGTWVYSEYDITASTQKIKVKQGKTTVTASSASNVLYSDRDNELEIRFDAVLNKTTDVEIAEVRLLNYTSDLALVDQSWTDEEGYECAGFWNPIDQTVILTQTDRKQIIAKGKSWNLKFEVVYRDKAGNEKNKQVTYKVVIK